MNQLQRALIEKLGHDHGFEHVLASDATAVALVSARHAAAAKVVAPPAGGYMVHFTADIPALLPELNHSFGPQRAGADFVAESEAALATLLRRAAGLARALPSQAAQDYEASVATQLAQLPAGLGGTEVERLVRQRVGQQKFRDAMLDYWGGACAVTGVALPEVLRASHAKPWSECSSDAERLDVFNGFLLVANLDALFDRFLVSFDDGGGLWVSSRIGQAELRQLGFATALKLRWVTEQHKSYLAWHRARCSDIRSLA